MRKLDRDPTPPAGLNQYQHGRDQWKKEVPSAQVRTAIWDKLNAMQYQRCAYCEGPIDEKNRHIEHFHQRSRYPQNTFDWHNLFGSCQRKGSCGNHKDQCDRYDPDVLIKPDVEDPEQLLVFTRLGTILPRANLSDAEKNRAKETIRIMGLNGNGLNRARQNAMAHAVSLIKELDKYLDEFENADADSRALLEGEMQEINRKIEEEIQRTQSEPYATAIRHVLTQGLLTRNA